MKIKDKKTGKMYDPDKEFQKLFKLSWFIKMMKRMKFM